MAEPRRIVLTGATGFIGGHIARILLARGDELVVFSRDPEAARERVPGAATYVAWQPEETGPWASEIDGADAVIHCAAPSIFDTRYTHEYARESLDNRVRSTRGLVRAMSEARIRPGAFVNASSQGIYGFGPVTDEPVDESSPVDSGYWGQDSVPWEAAALAAEDLGVRTVLIRTGYVLGENGGGLPYHIGQALAGHGAVSAPGDAWCSWIHIADEARLFVFALDEQTASGPLDATAPNPVRNRDYAAALAKATGRPVRMQPYLLTRVFVGKVAEIVAHQKRVLPTKALDLGFQFRFPTIDEALADLVPRIADTTRAQ